MLWTFPLQCIHMMCFVALSFSEIFRFLFDQNAPEPQPHDNYKRKDSNTQTEHGFIIYPKWPFRIILDSSSPCLSAQPFITVLPLKQRWIEDQSPLHSLCWLMECLAHWASPGWSMALSSLCLPMTFRTANSWVGQKLPLCCCSSTSHAHSLSIRAALLNKLCP